VLDYWKRRASRACVRALRLPFWRPPVFGLATVSTAKISIFSISLFFAI
jgi:hypothetical protein